MRRFGLQGVYEWGLLAVLFLIVLHAPFTVSLGNLLPAFALEMKVWKEILLSVLSVLAVVLLTRNNLWKPFLSSWVVRLSLAFIAVHLLFALILGGDVASIVAGLMIDLRFIVMFLLTYILILLKPESLRSIVRTVALGAVLVVGFGMLLITVLPDDTLRGIGYSSNTITPYTTIDGNQDYVRINSTLRGPNPLGALLVVYITLGLAYLAHRHARASVRTKTALWLGILAGVAVLFATYSRSAYVAFAASVAVLAAILVRPSKKIIAAAGIGLVVVAATLAVVSTTDWYSNVILHEDPESTTISKSNDEHVTSLATGFERTVSQPVGAGIGSTGSASLYDKDSTNDTIIENYYFFVAHEAGWLGLGLFIGIFGLVMYALWRRRARWISLGIFASGLGLALIGLLLPVWADESVALTWWALAGAAVAGTSGIMGDRHGKRTRN